MLACRQDLPQRNVRGTVGAQTLSTLQQRHRMLPTVMCPTASPQAGSECHVTRDLHNPLRPPLALQ